MKLKALLFVVTLFVGFGIFSHPTVEAAGGSLPPWPLIYTGNVTLGGEPAPDGLQIVAKIGEYTSIPSEIKDGRMIGMAVGPPDVTFFGQTITFELRNGDISVIAEETDVFTNLIAPTLRKDFHLTFPGFPTPTAIPTATATATPLPTSTPVATATPVPTATPVATATPIVVGTVVYNGVVVVPGGLVPENTMLTARVGGYESQPVPVRNGQFISLIVDLQDPAMTDREVKFYANGVESRTTVIYHVGQTIRNIDLIFMKLPGSTDTSTVSTDLSGSSADTLTPDVTADTAVPTVAAVVNPPPSPTSEPVPNTSIPAATVVPEVTTTSDLIVPAEEPEDSGGCFSVSEVDPLTGTANVLAMVGPLLFLAAYRGYRKLF